MSHRRSLIAIAGLALVLAGVGLSSPASADDLYDLGEYLSGECTACHQLSGKSDGIPAITGWPAESFELVMLAYKEGERDHALMQTVARRFSEDDFKALAVFFEKQGQQE